MRKLITISGINFKDSPKTRESLDEDAIREYSKSYQDSVPLPPPLLYSTKLHGLLVADGMHRFGAMALNKAKQALCEIKEGTRADCFNASVMENLRHGVRRTNADKRQSVITALSIYHEVADLKIAEICHVSHSTVADVRKMLETSGTITKREKIQTADGKTRPVQKQARVPNRQSQSKSDSVPVPTDAGVHGADKSASAPAPALDATGYPIPEKALPIWNRGSIAEDIVVQAQDLRRRIDARAQDKDPLFSEVNLNAVDCLLEDLISRLQAAVPYAVCPICQGKLPENCTLCGRRGMVSKQKYERTDPKLLKARELAVKGAK